MGESNRYAQFETKIEAVFDLQIVLAKLRNLDNFIGFSQTAETNVSAVSC